MTFHTGQRVIWRYTTGWGGGITALANAEVVRVNTKTVTIRVWRIVKGVRIAEVKRVSPSSLEANSL